MIDARNQTDALAYSVEKTLNENRGRLSSAEISRIEAALAAVKHAGRGDDLSAIRGAGDELQRASHAIAEALYKNAQAQGPGGARSGAGGGEASGVKEGEVVGEYAETDK